MMPLGSAAKFDDLVCWDYMSGRVFTNITDHTQR